MISNYCSYDRWISFRKNPILGRLLISRSTSNEKLSKMVEKSVQFVIGYATILILEKYVILQTSICDITTEGDYKSADCRSKTFDNVPQDLDKDIKKLDLSGSTVKEGLKGDSFKAYSNLEVLKLENIKLKNDIVDKYAFESLTKLQEIYIKDVRLTTASVIQWPTSIKILNVTGCLATKLNLLNLDKLRTLNAEVNDLEDIPLFNELTTIEYANLQYNPLGEATVMSLARSCRVEHFDFHLTGNSLLKNADKYCTCVAILEWMTKFNIKSNIQTDPDSFKCSPAAAKDTVCPKEIPPAALKAREECLAKLNSPTSYFWIIVAIAFAIVLVLCTLCILAYLLKKDEKEEAEELEHQLHHKEQEQEQEQGEPQPDDDTSATTSEENINEENEQV